MVAYLETDELVVGVKYDCETYDGESCILEYTGDGMFEGDMPIEEVVRYVFKETIMTIEQLRADYEDLKNCSHYPAMERIMSVMPMTLDVLEKAIVWRNYGCGDSDSQELLVAVERFPG